jgi:TonB family protein
VAAAVAAETDPVAFQEELRALITLRPPARDGEVLAGLKTADQAATAAALLGRARGAGALAHLAALRKAGLDGTDAMADAALGAGDYDGVAAAALATGDAELWSSVSAGVAHVGARLSATTLDAALHSSPAIREATERADRERSGLQPRFPPSGLFTLGGLPPGYATAVLTETGCHPKKDLVATIEIVYGADGRPRSLGPLKGDLETGCRESITVLGASSLAPDWLVVPAGKPIGLVMLLDPESLACADDSPTRRRSKRVRSVGPTHPPKKVRDAAPAYPPEAAHMDGSGVVVVEAMISPEGCVAGQRLVSAGYPGFVWPAMRAISRWRYEPTVVDGHPVPVLMMATVNFRRN